MTPHHCYTCTCDEIDISDLPVGSLVSFTHTGYQPFRTVTAVLLAGKRWADLDGISTYWNLYSREFSGLRIIYRND